MITVGEYVTNITYYVTFVESYSLNLATTNLSTDIVPYKIISSDIYLIITVNEYTTNIVY